MWEDFPGWPLAAALSASAVGSPHHLFAQGGEETLSLVSDDLDGVGCLSDAQVDVVGITLAAAIDGNEETVAPALHAEAHLAVVAQHDGAHVEAVGCHGREADGIALWHNDGASHAERVGRAASGCACDESIGLVGGQVFVVDVRMDGNHGRDVVLQQGYLVQCEGIALQFHLIARDGEHTVRLHAEVAVVDVGQCGLDVVGRETGQKAEPSRVDADDGNLLVAHAAGHVEKSAVAAHAHHVVGGELVVLDDFACGHVYLQIFVQKLVKGFGHGQFGLPLGGDGEKFLHGGTLALLVYVAKQGELQFFSHI